jgi:hypothetical protein
MPFIFQSHWGLNVQGVEPRILCQAPPTYSARLGFYGARCWLSWPHVCCILRYFAKGLQCNDIETELAGSAITSICWHGQQLQKVCVGICISPCNLYQLLTPCFIYKPTKILKIICWATYVFTWWPSILRNLILYTSPIFWGISSCILIIVSVKFIMLFVIKKMTTDYLLRSYFILITRGSQKVRFPILLPPNNFT